MDSGSPNLPRAIDSYGVVVQLAGDASLKTMTVWVRIPPALLEDIMYETERIFYQSSGTLHYSTIRDGTYKLIVDVDQGIADFYRKLVPKARYVQRQGFPAHISVVRKITELNTEVWGKYENEVVDFLYNPTIDWCTVYYWINAYSARLEQIREELNLPVYDSVGVPEGCRQAFHITIGNLKGKM